VHHQRPVALSLIVSQRRSAATTRIASLCRGAPCLRYIVIPTVNHPVLVVALTAAPSACICLFKSFIVTEAVPLTDDQRVSSFLFYLLPE